MDRIRQRLKKKIYLIYANLTIQVKTYISSELDYEWINWPNSQNETRTVKI